MSGFPPQKGELLEELVKVLGYEVIRCETCEGLGLVGSGVISDCKKCDGKGWKLEPR